MVSNCGLLKFNVEQIQMIAKLIDLENYIACAFVVCVEIPPLFVDINQSWRRRGHWREFRPRWREP